MCVAFIDSYNHIDDGYQPKNVQVKKIINLFQFVKGLLFCCCSVVIKFFVLNMKMNMNIKSWKGHEPPEIPNTKIKS